MERIELLATTARRTRAINSVLGTALSPEHIAAQFADEDIELLIAWMESPAYAGR